MDYDFDYGFDVDSLEVGKGLKRDSSEAELDDTVPYSNEYDEGEKEAIDKWIKEHKKSS